MAKPIRYCPECGLIGEIPEGKKGCCPDGVMAVRIPPNVAIQAHAGFQAALALYTGKQRGGTNNDTNRI